MYRKINGRDLYSIVSNSELRKLLPLEKLKRILKKLLLQLIVLQEGPFRFTHNDLNVRNVMIENLETDDPNVYIIDYGLNSFEVYDIHISSFMERDFLAPLRKRNIVSGVEDFFQLLCYLENIDEYYSYVAKIRFNLLCDGYQTPNGTAIDKLEMFNKVSNFYYENPLLPQCSQFNLDVLKKRTYLWLYREIQTGKGKEKSQFDDTGMNDVESYLSTYRLYLPNQYISKFAINYNDQSENAERVIRETLLHSQMDYEFSIQLLHHYYYMISFSPEDTINHTLLPLSILYITRLLFDPKRINQFVNEYLEPWLEQHSRSYEVADVIQNVKHVISQLNWKVQPFTFMTSRVPTRDNE